MTGKRVDNNHVEIRDGLREVGYAVFDTSRLGFGFPDILVISKSGIAVLAELKSEKGILTRREHEFHRQYFGPLEIWRSLEQAIERMFYWDLQEIK